MAKTKEELSELKKEYMKTQAKLAELTSEELFQVIGGNSWNANPGEDVIPSYWDYYCIGCGYVDYRIPTSQSKSCDDQYKLCPGCGKTTYHTWKLINLF